MSLMYLSAVLVLERWANNFEPNFPFSLDNTIETIFNFSKAPVFFSTLEHKLKCSKLGNYFYLLTFYDFSSPWFESCFLFVQEELLSSVLLLNFPWQVVLSQIFPKSFSSFSSEVKTYEEHFLICISFN